MLFGIAADMPTTQKCPESAHEVTCVNGVIRYPPNVEDVGESSDGSTDYYRCKTCGQHWSVHYSN